MFCSKCGEDNPDDGGFCQKCGASLDSSGGASAGGSKVSAPSLGNVSDMVKGLPIGMILMLGAALALFISFLTGILAAAGAGDYVEGSTKAAWFFDHVVNGILVCGVLSGLAVLSKGNLPDMVKSLPMGMILILGGVLALFLAFLTGILYAAGAEGTEGTWKGSLFFEQMVNGILVCGVLGGLSALIAKAQD